MVENVLHGRVAIVTGAGSPRGTGHAMVIGLVRAGARVAMLDLNQEWLAHSLRDAREVGGAPAVWLASDASQTCNGRRIIAYHWDAHLSLEERLAKASAPAAWPQLGQQAILPRR